MQSYRKPAFTGARDEDTREDLEGVIADLVERNAPATPEVVNALLEQRREYKARVKRATLVDLPDDLEYTAALREEMERQYPIMEDALERFGIRPYDSLAKYMYPAPPALYKVHALMKPEVLKHAINIVQPTFLMVPPIDTQEMIRTINAHRLPRQKRCEYPGTRWFTSYFNDYWPVTGKKWGVAIAEGCEDVKVPSEISGIGYNDTRFDMWHKRLQGRGLDALDSANAWLTLWMMKAHHGVMIDPYCPNILQGRFSDLKPPIACAKWSGRRIEFEETRGNDNWPSLSMRGLVWLQRP